MKIYLIGPTYKKNWKEKFKETSEYLKDKGHTVLNPENVAVNKRNKLLRDCDGVYMMKGWTHLTFCNHEYGLAMCYKKIIFYFMEEVWNER